jgi:hypothetical protein
LARYKFLKRRNDFLESTFNRCIEIFIICHR